MLPKISFIPRSQICYCPIPSTTTHQPKQTPLGSGGSQDLRIFRNIHSIFFVAHLYFPPDAWIFLLDWDQPPRNCRPPSSRFKYFFCKPVNVNEGIIAAHAQCGVTRVRSAAAGRSFLCLLNSARPAVAAAALFLSVPPLRGPAPGWRLAAFPACRDWECDRSEFSITSELDPALPGPSKTLTSALIAISGIPKS